MKFRFNKEGMMLDIGDLSDPKFKGPLCTDLVKKATDDIMKALDRVMDVVPLACEDDFELEVFIKNSLMVSTSTNLMAKAMEFLIYTQSMGHINSDDMGHKEYTEKVVEHLTMVGKVMIAGHMAKLERKKAH